MRETELKNTSETGCIILCGSEYRKPESQLPGTTERIICKVQ